MKKVLITAATVSSIFFATHAFAVANTGTLGMSTNSNANMVNENSLTASISVNAKPSALHGSFTQVIDVAKEEAQKAGYFTLSGLDAGRDYLLGNVSANGPDASAYGNGGTTNVCFETSTPSTDVCSDKIAINNVDSGDLFVKLIHSSGYPKAGVTNIVVPVTSYHQ